MIQKYTSFFKNNQIIETNNLKNSNKKMNKPHISETNKKINDFDLFDNFYSIEILEKNVNNLSPKIILKTQILNAYFCAKYILNEKYAWSQEDTYITNSDVLEKQPHILNKNLMDECQKHIKN
jgi:hypothetical protein